jgi:hypothetical protein
MYQVAVTMSFLGCYSQCSQHDPWSSVATVPSQARPLEGETRAASIIACTLVTITFYRVSEDKDGANNQKDVQSLPLPRTTRWNCALFNAAAKATFHYSWQGCCCRRDHETPSLPTGSLLHHLEQPKTCRSSLWSLRQTARQVARQGMKRGRQTAKACQKHQHCWVLP